MITLIITSGTAHAVSATVNWNANTESDLAGYRVYYGAAPGTYSQTVDVGLTTSHSITGLVDGSTYYISVTAYDTSGNESTPSIEAVFSIASVDTTPPQLTPPANVVTEATGALTDVALGNAIAIDPEDGQVLAIASTTGPFAPGLHVITWSATDSAGNTSTATQTVTITDTIGPTVIPPADVTIEAVDLLTDVPLGTASASDLVDGAVTATADNPGPFARGTHTVTWSATDSEGNTATAVQTVTVTDTTAPASPQGLMAASP